MLKGKCIWAATLAVVTWLVIVIFRPRHRYFQVTSSFCQATSSLFSCHVIVISGHVTVFSGHVIVIHSSYPLRHNSPAPSERQPCCNTLRFATHFVPLLVDTPYQCPSQDPHRNAAEPVPKNKGKLGRNWRNKSSAFLMRLEN